MTETTIRIAEEVGTDVSSRRVAARVRKDVVSAVSAGMGPVVVDFSGVRSISNSFADELLAILVARHGRQWFRDHVKVVGLDAYDRDAILRTIAGRIQYEQRDSVSP